MSYIEIIKILFLEKYTSPYTSEIHLFYNEPQPNLITENQHLAIQVQRGYLMTESMRFSPILPRTQKRKPISTFCGLWKTNRHRWTLPDRTHELAAESVVPPIQNIGISWRKHRNFRYPQQNDFARTFYLLPCCKQKQSLHTG